jgi:hypothetical protein
VNAEIGCGCASLLAPKINGGVEGRVGKGFCPFLEMVGRAKRGDCGGSEKAEVGEEPMGASRRPNAIDANGAE